MNIKELTINNGILILGETWEGRGGREGDIPIIQTGGGGDGAGRDIPPQPICGGTNDFRGPWGKGDDDEADFSGGNSSGGGRDWSRIEDDYGFGPPDHHISGDGIVIDPPDFNGVFHAEGDELGGNSCIHGDGIFGGVGVIAWPTGGGGENIDEADGEGGIKFGNQNYDGIKFGGSDFIDWPPGDTIPGLPIQWAVWPPGDIMPVQIDTNLP